MLFYACTCTVTTKAHWAHSSGALRTSRNSRISMVPVRHFACANISRTLRRAQVLFTQRSLLVRRMQCSCCLGYKPSWQNGCCAFIMHQDNRIAFHRNICTEHPSQQRQCDVPCSACGKSCIKEKCLHFTSFHVFFLFFCYALCTIFHRLIIERIH